MGVPKFFRYISERYPCLSELVKETQIPEFDNLYLDMNGIIHNCSHPDDDNVHFRITEEQIFTDIFHYIDTLFRMIRPRRLFFMAVDGVAPRAKMNQQRGRRFRSAKEAETKENLARQKGEQLPDTVRFDSNCITPGTAFMVRLQQGLRHFVQNKISTNPLWRQCRVILSGHETPGEGEHKIMEYIRYLKATPQFDPNTRHCLYGLDADLVMLGLCSHELHFSLLREEVKFGSKAKKSTSVDGTRFFLLHLGLMREYLELEFVDVKEHLPFQYDMDAIVDDWILMCYLVGNDFIPNLPNFHLNTNALPTLYTAYKKVLPELGGYINEAGVLNLRRLEVFLAELGEVDRDMFRQKNGNLECLRVDNAETFGNFEMNVAGDAMGDTNGGGGGNDELAQLAQNTLDMYLGGDEDEDDSDEAVEEREFHVHKRDYYINKMGYEEMTPEVLAEQAECYVRALQWTLYYYYRGVKSWCWYYPHHYAPYISDVRNFSHLKFDYEEGTPFLPFQQLLAVLPAASREHLPSAYHRLMTDAESRVIDYYPANFETDLNGKKQDWEAVVLIPFIDERRLLEAMAECEDALTADEVERNAHGPMYQYEYSVRDGGARPESQQYGLAALAHTYCTETAVYRKELHVHDDQLVLGTSAGVLRDVYFPGFPSFKHHRYTGKVLSVRAKVFDMPSNNPSMVIHLQQTAADDVDNHQMALKAANDADDDDDDASRPVGLARLQQMASGLIGQVVFVGWPHLCEARVQSVSDCDYVCLANDESRKSQRHEFDMQVKSLKMHHKTRMGIDIGRTRVLITTNLLQERKYVFGERGSMTLTRVWNPIAVAYPLQTIVRTVRMHRSTANAEHTRVADVFPVGCTIFMASNNLYYGSQGSVVDVSAVERTGRLIVELHDIPQPDFTAAHQLENSASTHYMSGQQAASSIGMHPAVFGQITGTCLITRGPPRFPLLDNTPRTNIGLQLKFPKRSEELVGFSRRSGKSFLYSQRAVDLVRAYAQRWPQVMLALRKRKGGFDNNEPQFETEVFPPANGEPAGQSTAQMQELQAWLKQQPHQQAERRACDARALDEGTMRELVAAVERLQRQLDERQGGAGRAVQLKVQPNSLYKPDLGDAKSAPDANARYELFDRVVMAKETHSVPLGLRGTVVGIHSVVDPNPVRHDNQRKADMFYDVLFDQSFDDGGNMIGVAEKRMFKMSPLHLMNITFGIGNCKNQRDAFPIAAAVTNQQPRTQPAGDLSKQSSADIWALLKKSSKQNANEGEKAAAAALMQQQVAQAPPIRLLKREPPPPQQQQQRQQPKQPQPGTQPPKPAPAANTPVAIDEKAAFQQLLSKISVPAGAANVGPAPAPVASTEQYQKINLEDMFRVDTASLPKPPANWRNRVSVPEPNAQPHPLNNQPPPPIAQRFPAASMCFPSFAQPPPPPFGPMQQQHQQQHISQMPSMPTPPIPAMVPMPMFGFGPPSHQQQQQQQQQQQSQQQQQNNQQLMEAQQQRTFFPQQQQYRQGGGGGHRQGPQGPQNLRQNDRADGSSGAGNSAGGSGGFSASATGHGAFIPLQATRKQAANRRAAAAAAASASDASAAVPQSVRRPAAAPAAPAAAAAAAATNTKSPKTKTTPNKEAASLAEKPVAASANNRPRASGGAAERHRPRPSRIAARFDVNP